MIIYPPHVGLACAAGMMNLGATEEEWRRVAYDEGEIGEGFCGGPLG